MFTWLVLEPRVSVLPRLTLKICHNCYLKDISEEHEETNGKLLHRLAKKNFKKITVHFGFLIPCSQTALIVFLC